MSMIDFIAALKAATMQCTDKHRFDEDEIADIAQRRPMRADCPASRHDVGDKSERFRRCAETRIFSALEIAMELTTSQVAYDNRPKACARE